MKMYYFSRGGYHEEYHVMAKSKRDALLYLKRYFSEKEPEKEPTLSSYMTNYYNSQYEFFEQNHEHIYEYDEGQVVQTEVS